MLSPGVGASSPSPLAHGNATESAVSAPAARAAAPLQRIGNTPAAAPRARVPVLPAANADSPPKGDAPPAQTDAVAAALMLLHHHGELHPTLAAELQEQLRIPLERLGLAQDFPFGEQALMRYLQNLSAAQRDRLCHAADPGALSPAACLLHDYLAYAQASLTVHVLRDAGGGRPLPAQQRLLPRAMTLNAAQALQSALAARIRDWQSRSHHELDALRERDHAMRLREWQQTLPAWLFSHAATVAVAQAVPGTALLRSLTALPGLLADPLRTGPLCNAAGAIANAERPSAVLSAINHLLGEGLVTPAMVVQSCAAAAMNPLGALAGVIVAATVQSGVDAARACLQRRFGLPVAEAAKCITEAYALIHTASAAQTVLSSAVDAWMQPQQAGADALQLTDDATDTAPDVHARLQALVDSIDATGMDVDRFTRLAQTFQRRLPAHQQLDAAQLAALHHTRQLPPTAPPQSTTALARVDAAPQDDGVASAAVPSSSAGAWPGLFALWPLWRTAGEGFTGVGNVADVEAATAVLPGAAQPLLPTAGAASRATARTGVLRNAMTIVVPGTLAALGIAGLSGRLLQSLGAAQEEDAATPAPLPAANATAVIEEQRDGSWADATSLSLAAALDAVDPALQPSDGSPAQRVRRSAGDSDRTAEATATNVPRQQTLQRRADALFLLDLGATLARQQDWQGWNTAPAAEQLLLVSRYLQLQRARGEVKSLQQAQGQHIASALSAAGVTDAARLLAQAQVTLADATTLPLLPYLVHRREAGDPTPVVAAPGNLMDSGTTAIVQRFIAGFDPVTSLPAALKQGSFSQAEEAEAAMRAALAFDAVRHKVRGTTFPHPASALLLKLLNQAPGVQLATLAVTLTGGERRDAGAAVHVDVPDYLFVRSSSDPDAGVLVYRPDVSDFKFLDGADEFRNYLVPRQAVLDTAGGWGDAATFTDRVLAHVPAARRAWAEDLLGSATTADWIIKATDLPAAGTAPLSTSRAHGARDRLVQASDRRVGGRSAPQVIVDCQFREDVDAVDQWTRRAIADGLQQLHRQDALDAVQYSATGAAAEAAARGFAAATRTALPDYADVLAPTISAALNDLLPAGQHIDPGAITVTVDGKQGKRTASLLSWATYGWYEHGLETRYSDSRTAQYDPQWPRAKDLQRVTFAVTRRTAAGDAPDPAATDLLNDPATKKRIIRNVLDVYGWQKKGLAHYSARISTAVASADGELVQACQRLALDGSRLMIARGEAQQALPVAAAAALRATLETIDTQGAAAPALKAVSVAGKAVAGIWALSAAGTDYVFAPGSHYTLPVAWEDFVRDINQSTRLHDFLLAQASLEDGDALRRAFAARSATPVTARATLSSPLGMAQQLVARKLGDIDAAISTPGQDRLRGLENIARALLVAPCIAGGPAAAAVCVAGTGAFVIKDSVDAARAWRRGDLDKALELALGASLDALDIGEVVNSRWMLPLLFRAKRSLTSLRTPADVRSLFDSLRQQNRVVDVDGVVLGTPGALQAVDDAPIQLIGEVEHIRTDDGHLLPTWVDEDGVRRLTQARDAPVDRSTGAWRLLDAAPDPMTTLRQRVQDGEAVTRWLPAPRLDAVLETLGVSDYAALSPRDRATLRAAAIRARVDERAAVLATADTQRMTTQGNGVYDLDGRQYIRLHDAWLETEIRPERGGGRYVMGTTGVDASFRVHRVDGEWRVDVQPRGGMKGGIREPLERQVSQVRASLDRDFPMGELLDDGDLDAMVAVFGTADSRDPLLRDAVRRSARSRFIEDIGSGALPSSAIDDPFYGDQARLGTLIAFFQTPELCQGRGLLLTLGDEGSTRRLLSLQGETDPVRVYSQSGLPSLQALISELGADALRSRLGMAAHETEAALLARVKAHVAATLQQRAARIETLWSEAEQSLSLDDITQAEHQLMARMDMGLPQAQAFLQRYPQAEPHLMEGAFPSQVREALDEFKASYEKIVARRDIVAGAPTSLLATQELALSLGNAVPGSAATALLSGGHPAIRVSHGGTITTVVFRDNAAWVAAQRYDDWAEALQASNAGRQTLSADALRRSVLRDLGGRSPATGVRVTARADLDPLQACAWSGRSPRALCTDRVAPAPVAQRWKAMLDTVSPAQWKAAGNGVEGANANVLVIDHDLRVDGKPLPGESKVYVSAARLAQPSLGLGFVRSPLQQVEVVLPIRPRPGVLPKAVNPGRPGDFNANDFDLASVPLNDVQVDGRYWKGKARPPGAGDADVRVRQMTAADRQALSRSHDRKMLSNINDGDYYLQTRIRRCTEVQALEDLADRVLGPDGQRRTGKDITGDLYIVTKWKPCLTNCQDLIQEVARAWPKVNVFVGVGSDTSSAQIWRVNAPIQLARPAGVAYAPASPPALSAWATPLAVRPPLAAPASRKTAAVQVDIAAGQTRGGFNVQATAFVPGRPGLDPRAADFVPRRPPTDR